MWRVAQVILLPCALAASAAVKDDTCSTPQGIKASSLLQARGTVSQAAILNRGKAQVRNQCPAGSSAFTADATPRKLTTTPAYNNVQLADYPSSGSTWLRFLLKEAAHSAEGGLGAPFCAIYPDGQPIYKIDGVHCETDWNREQGARLVKSHFPTASLAKFQPIDQDWEYRATMTFDKLVLMTRHPVTVVKSVMGRWGGDAASLSESLRCWGEWWDRVKLRAGPQNVHMLAYENLCWNTAEEVHKVFQFLGGRYAVISLQTVKKMLATHPKLQCMYSDPLNTPGPWVNPSVIKNGVGRIYDLWGYREMDARVSNGTLGLSINNTHALGENFSIGGNP